jgi:regulator of cell morphogenesis and NO signaling
MINHGITVREIALQVPQATRLFETLKIDYCCGGDRPLNEACMSAGLDTTDVVRMLDELSESETSGNADVDFQTLSPEQLIAHIVQTHHVYTKDEMVRLDALLKKVIAAHGENHPELERVRQLFEQLCAELKPHMFKEEQILFPYITELTKASLRNHPAPFAPFGRVTNPVRMMMMEHDKAGEILRELRTVTSGYVVPADGCISYRTLFEAMAALEKDLHQHIHLENNILFPRAIEIEAELKS